MCLGLIAIEALSATEMPSGHLAPIGLKKDISPRLFFSLQPSDTFLNLSAGEYQIRMTDACNN